MEPNAGHDKKQSRETERLAIVGAATTYRLLEAHTRVTELTRNSGNISDEARNKKEEVIRQQRAMMTELSRANNLLIGGRNGSEIIGKRISFHPEEHEEGHNPNVPTKLHIGDDVDVIASAISWKDPRTNEIQTIFPAKVVPAL